MKAWQERRDELAGEYAHRHEKMGASHEHAECMFAGFLTGFDAGRADALREVREKLAEVKLVIGDLMAFKENPEWVIKNGYKAQADLDALLKDLAEQEKEGSYVK